jgi:glucose/arabinose dehydrogenase
MKLLGRIVAVSIVFSILAFAGYLLVDPRINEAPIAAEAVLAFGTVHWTDWQAWTDNGLPNPLRPIVLTHAGDGTNRVFVATQQGVIHVFANDAEGVRTEVFLDYRDRVVYNEAEIEEGFLGLTFHPHYKANGEFFVYYTTNQTTQKHTNVLSRLRVTKDNPNHADRYSEEVILRIERPYWNHNGGTICFGPDGYLYVAVGDGGSAGDPLKNGQNLGTLLGKILRIDVDNKEPGKNYAIPRDNPFVCREDARPETWAYGLRNVWRMAFDRKTGALWAADVGQDLYEEIDIIVKGGNYGWSLREGQHAFGADGCDSKPHLIDPIWEYSHKVGVCIIGGCVYRGTCVPEIDGVYLYGDYVTGKMWALQYDPVTKRVVANRPIKTPEKPILSFGEDEQGEVYFLTSTQTGKGIYQIKSHLLKTAG